MSESKNQQNNPTNSANKLAVSETRKSMLDILLLLMAPTVMAWYYYGSRAFKLIFICIITAILTELTASAIVKAKAYISDFSSIVTAVCIALCMPAGVSWWIPCVSVIFAVAVVKIPFGNSRSLMFSPAAAAIAFATICFPQEIFAYPIIPRYADELTLFSSEDFVRGDSIAYMLSHSNSIGVNIVNYIDIAVGNVSGPMGATCAIAMIGGLIYLVFRRPKAAVVSISFIITCAIFAALFPRITTSRMISVIMELSAGLLFFSALTFISNEAIAPKRFISRVLYGVFGGLVTMLLRKYSPLEDSTAFAVLLMNSFMPVFDSKIPVFGLEKKHMLKELYTAKQEKERLEKELEEIEKVQREEAQIAQINAILEPKRSKMVQTISQSIRNRAITEINDIADEASETISEDDGISVKEEIDDDIPDLHDIGELAEKYEIEINNKSNPADGGDSDE